ncbi:hypothetical protein GCM10020358_60260 [Amorphoplanes nipponensis]|uniref:Uncharacterized protein n=1 Tax=Actinoplanes nipponensis TaxID=135950 RepID=A0A919JCB3_9ACTN|nr:hypothetical protein [Actinoplanes nipponensis]GIE47198.1 hypothetical protein Ani05nite_07320 [Actinoplanes nipponensis]
MNSWIFLSASLTTPAGVGRVAYGQAMVVAHSVEDRVNRSFAGAAWLRQRFPARSCVQVQLLPRDDTVVGVEYVRKKNYGGPKEIRCGLRLPAAWFADPPIGDGLTGLRLFQAVQHALHAIGDQYGIGVPAAVGPAADRGRPELENPFRPPPSGPSRYAAAALELQRLAHSTRPDQMVLVAKEPPSAAVAEQHRAVIEALGTVVARHTVATPDGEAEAWTIHIR